MREANQSDAGIAAARIALDRTRDGFPEPTLVPHLVRSVADAHLPMLLDFADDMANGRTALPPWPRLLSATCAWLAPRLGDTTDRNLLDRLLDHTPALYSHLGASLLDAALTGLLVETGPYQAATRAEKICRLAARYPDHEGGVLIDLAAAALVDLDPADAHRASAWFVPLTDGAERQAIIAAWATPDTVEPDAFAALLGAADYDERILLTNGILKLLEQPDLLPLAVVVTIATLLPDFAAGRVADARRLLGNALGTVADTAPPWWLALAASRIATVDDEIGLRFPNVGPAWGKTLGSFKQLPADSGFADVMRAHPGAALWMTSPGYPGLNPDESLRLLEALLGQSGMAQQEASGAGDIPGPGPGPGPGPEPEPEPEPTEPVDDPSASDEDGDLGDDSDDDDASDDDEPRSGGLGGLIRDVIGGGLIDRIFRGGGSGKSGTSSPTRGPPPGSVVEPQADRRLQADVYVTDDQASTVPARPVTAFVAGKTHAVDLSIGRGGRIRVGVAFAEPEFRADRETEKLDIRLIHGDSVKSGTLELPRDTTKNSGKWRALLDVANDADTVEATVVVLHNGRVLQAAILSGQVVQSAQAPDGSAPGIGFTVVADVHAFAHLADRGTFDASIVTDGATGTAFAGASIGVRDLNGIDGTINKLMDKLFKSSEAVAMSGTGGDPAAYEKLLVVLAAHGKLLHSVLIRQLMPELDKARRIQIVSTNPSAILPLELVYSGPGPTHSAKLCQRWHEALGDGADAVCPDCSTRPADERSDIVCPLHFWALSRIIERHAPAKPRPDGHDFYVETRETGVRERLAPLQRAVFAASDNVPEALVDATLAVLKTTVPACDDVQTWADWAESVHSHAPTLLVSMPHNALDPLLEIATLEIGGGNELRAGEVSRKLVCRDDAGIGPVIVLLGCQTAHGGPQPFHTFVGEFRNNGAAIVIGTLASVLGEHAAPVVQAILKALADPVRTGQDTFGDLLLRIRRQMFADGIVIALAVCAFGDADWALATPGD